MPRVALDNAAAHQLANQLADVALAEPGRCRQIVVIHRSFDGGDDLLHRRIVQLVGMLFRQARAGARWC